jgi:transposase
VPVPEELSREELIVVVRRQAGQIIAQAGQIPELMEANEALSGKLAKLEHLLSRNSGNSSNPPSRDDDPGKPAPPEKKERGGGGPKRPRGKQRGAPGSHLPWTENPDDRRDQFPRGRCDCGDDLGAARDLGIVDRYQQHEIPQVSVQVIQYGQHQVVCGCGKVHTAGRPEGARCGPVGYGPLCRTRHKGPYAERPVMPRCPWVCCVVRGTVRGARHNVAGQVVGVRGR